MYICEYDLLIIIFSVHHLQCAGLKSSLKRTNFSSHMLAHAYRNYKFYMMMLFACICNYSYI